MISGKSTVKETSICVFLILDIWSRKPQSTVTRYAICTGTKKIRVGIETQNANFWINHGLVQRRSRKRTPILDVNGCKSVTYGVDRAAATEKTEV